jgi:hypothetical protein
MPWSIVTLVASLITHFKVVDLPWFISAGVAAKSIIAGGAGRQAMAENSDRRASTQNIIIYLLDLIFIRVLYVLQHV